MADKQASEDFTTQTRRFQVRVELEERVDKCIEDEVRVDLSKLSFDDKLAILLDEYDKQKESTTTTKRQPAVSATQAKPKNTKTLSKKKTNNFRR